MAFILTVIALFWVYCMYKALTMPKAKDLNKKALRNNANENSKKIVSQLKKPISKNTKQFSEHKESQTNELGFAEFNILMANICNHVSNTSGNKINKEKRDWIKDKKRNYSGKDYIDQLEKNAIYATELSLKSMSAFTTFVFSDYKIEEDLALAHIKHGRELAGMSVHEHLAYLRGESEASSAAQVIAAMRGESVTSGSENYDGLKKIRESGQQDKYIDELEFWCLYYFAWDNVTLEFIQFFLHNHNLFDRLGKIPEDIIKHEAMKYINICTNLSIGNMEIKT